jgi:hypothetical protein
MSENPNTVIAEFFDFMVGTYETWAEPLSACLAQVALERTSVGAGDCVLDIGAGTVLWHIRQPPSARQLPLSIFRPVWLLD